MFANFCQIKSSVGLCGRDKQITMAAERGVAAAVGEAAERGVEAEELPHALAPGAGGAAPAPGEVADEELQAPACRVRRARRLGRRLPHGADLRAALLADVPQAVHGVAQLHVHLLLRALPTPLSPALHAYIKVSVSFDSGSRLILTR